jgi:hypothetical protein
MAIKKTSRTQFDPAQADLFDTIAKDAGVTELIEVPELPEAKSIDLKVATAEWLTASIKNSGKTREYISEVLTSWTGIEVSKDTIDMWTKKSHPTSMPAHFLPPMAIILGANFLDWFAQKAGCRVAGTNQLLMAQIGQMVVVKKHAEAEMQRAIADLPLMQAGGAL